MTEPASAELHATFGEHTINQLVLMFRENQINLNPGFQRHSVWTSLDRRRRIIWNSDEKRNCKICGKPLTWGDVSIDHIIAYTKGGRTTLKNAQL